MDDRAADDLSARMRDRLEERRSTQALRSLSGNGPGSDFSSNDYLGLASGGELASAIARRLENVSNAGAGGSRLLTGNAELTEALEAQSAAFHRAEAGLFFSSGYAANSGLISTIAAREDTIFYDELVHASIHEGMRLSPAKRIAFAHNSAESLRSLAAEAGGQVFVVCESLYSMDGDLAPLAELASLCNERGWHLIADEAHAGGLAGSRGEGLVAALGLEEQVFARVITYGKAFGAAGGMVLGSSRLRQYLINFCRAFIYSTGPMPAQVIAVQEAYRLVESATPERQRIRELRRRLLAGLPRRFYTMNYVVEKEIESPSAIVPLHWPGNEQVVFLSRELATKGFDLRPIRYPSVAKDSERLRCCLHAFNTPEQVDSLLYALDSFR